MVVSADRAEYGLQEPIVAELKRIETIEVAWCLLDSQAIPEDNLAKFRSELEVFTPDIVVVPTDRTEITYISAFAFHNGYIVAHFHAGNNPTNHPDDINRRVISCFSHILFANMSEHRQNLIKQGEEDWRVHVVGSTAFDDVIFDDTITPQESFDLVILHPDPQSAEKTKHDLEATIATISNSTCVIWIYPNHDKNYEIIEEYLDNSPSETMIKYQNLPRNQYFSLLKNCSKAIGNSSSFYYEMPVLDKREKLIQIGDRNKGLIVPETTTGGSKRIAKILANIELTDKLKEKWKKDGKEI